MTMHEPGDHLRPPPTITCVDCGGTCHLMTPPPRDEEDGRVGYRDGDVVAYRCEDCLDRWDLELAGEP